MAQPGQNDLRVIDPILTDLSIGYKNPMFLWDQLAPVVDKDEMSGTYPVYTRDFWFRRPGADGRGADRAPATGYLRVGYGVEWQTYRTSEIGFEKALDRSIRASAQTAEDPETVDTMFLANLMQLELEKRVASTLFKSGVWADAPALATSDKWSDYSGSDPIEDSKKAIRAIRRATGEKPNTMFMGSVVWDYLKDHPMLLDKYKHTQTGILTPQLVAAALEVPEIIVGETVENTAAEGQDWSGVDIWGDSVLYYVKNSPTLSVANGAYTFMWNEASNVPWAVENYPDETIRSDVNRIFTHLDVEVVSQYHGYFLDGVTA